MNWTMEQEPALPLIERFNHGVAVLEKLQAQGRGLRAMILSPVQTMLLLTDVQHPEDVLTGTARCLAYDKDGVFAELETRIDGVLVRWRVRYRAVAPGGAA